MYGVGMNKKQKWKKVAEIIIEIPGEPRTKRTGTVSAYLVKVKGRMIAKGTLKAHPATVKGEEEIQSAFFQWFATAPPEVKALIEEQPWEGPFLYRHTYYFEMSVKEKKKYKNYEKILHSKKPDSDNLHKLSNDALEGFLFKNDSQGQDLGGRKWSVHHSPRTVLRYYLIEEVK